MLLLYPRQYWQQGQHWASEEWVETRQKIQFLELVLWLPPLIIQGFSLDVNGLICG